MRLLPFPMQISPFFSFSSALFFLFHWLLIFLLVFVVCRRCACCRLHLNFHVSNTNPTNAHSHTILIYYLFANDGQKSEPFFPLVLLSNIMRFWYLNIICSFASRCFPFLFLSVSGGVVCYRRTAFASSARWCTRRFLDRKPHRQFSIWFQYMNRHRIRNERNSRWTARFKENVARRQCDVLITLTDCSSSWDNSARKQITFAGIVCLALANGNQMHKACMRSRGNEIKIAISMGMPRSTKTMRRNDHQNSERRPL